MGTMFLAVLLFVMPGASVEMTLGARSQVLCEEMIKGMVEDVRQKGIPGFPGASMTIQRVCQPYTVAR